MTAASGRLLYSVTAPPTTGPARYDPGACSRANAAALAQSLWGGLRQQWCATLADDLGAARPLTRYTPHAQQWVAGILVAAAVDAGRDQRPGTWSRTLAAVAAASGVERDTALARYRDLVAMNLARPSVVPEPLRRDA